MIRLYFELLKSVLIRNIVYKRLGTTTAEVGTNGFRDSEALMEMITDLQLFAEQHHHTEALNEIMHRLRIVKTNETDYGTELTSSLEYDQVTVGDLEVRFNYYWTSWETVNEMSELMKFLILRWLDRFNAGGTGDRVVSDDWYGYARADGVRYQIWSLVVTVMRELADRYWVECYAIRLFAAWAKVIELLPTSEVVYDCKTLERLKTAVSEIPEKVASLDSVTFMAPCPICNPDYDVNKIWDEKANTNK